MEGTEHRSFDQPDGGRSLGQGTVSTLDLNAGSVARLQLQPGWRWSVDVAPNAGTALCELPHVWYHVAGRMGIRMGTGEGFEAGPGDVSVLPSGHDAWVIGDEPVVVVDWYGASKYSG